MKKINNFIIDNDDLLKEKSEDFLKKSRQYLLTNSLRTKNEHNYNIKSYINTIYNVISEFFSKDIYDFKLNKFKTNRDYNFLLFGKKVYVKLINENNEDLIVNMDIVKNNNTDYILVVKYNTENHFKNTNYEDENLKFSIQKSKNDIKLFCNISYLIPIHYLINNSTPTENGQPFDFKLNIKNLKNINIEDVEKILKNKLNLDENLKMKNIIKKTNDEIMPNLNKIRESRELYGRNKTKLHNYILINKKSGYKIFYDGNRITQEYKLLWLNSLIKNGSNFNNKVICKTNYSDLLNYILNLDINKKYAISSSFFHKHFKVNKNYVIKSKNNILYSPLIFNSELKEEFEYVLKNKNFKFGEKYIGFFLNVNIIENDNKNYLINNLSVNDLHEIYNSIRNYFRQKRKNINDKNRFDRQISEDNEIENKNVKVDYNFNLKKESIININK